MKLRMNDSSIRIRLTPTEVAALAAGNKLETSVLFGPLSGQRFTYAIETSERNPGVSADYSDGMVSVKLPEHLAYEWAGTDRVAIEGSQPVGRGHFLKILVEKDFQCLHPRAGEDEKDRFANPEALRTA